MRRKPLSPPRLLALHVAGLILAGTLLLALPVSGQHGRAVPLLDAFFTATSAVCVTGLIVNDTPNAYSTFGQIVLLLLIQAGGLGYMTISTVVAVALGRRITLQERLTLQEALNIYTREDLLRFAFRVLKLTLVFELTATAVLGFRFAPEHGIGRGLYLGLFHAVSAFNNAGFSLFSDNLVRYRSDVTVNLVITTLIIAGGLGFLVLSELIHLRARTRLSVHSRFALQITAGLLLSGTLLVGLLEWHNPATLGPLGAGEAWMAAYFQSVTARTAGFNTLAIGSMTEPALMVLVVLMFIGASPGSTGGGIKTTTFGVTVAAVWTTVRGSGDPVIAGRQLPRDLVARAFFISLIAMVSVVGIAWLVLLFEGRGLLPVFFETTSAFGTVGLSMGTAGSVLSLAGHMSVAGKTLLAVMMYVGRVGPLTLAVALAQGRPPAQVRYPDAKILIG